MNSLHKVLGYAAFTAVIFYLADIFYHIPFLTYSYSILAIILLICSIYYMRLANRIVIFSLLIAGTGMYSQYPAGAETVLLSFGSNMNLLALFLLVPLFGTFMSVAGFLKALQHAIRKREEKHKSHPYRTGYILYGFIT
ncbi:hypothetical protein [Alteribacillus sp. HJP-4]|uniref:hypothetical protein n=1 Tax=Alteribacillus sp. HJP-4 TaxID=2775394 RepID=UPI0035CCE7A9